MSTKTGIGVFVAALVVGIIVFKGIEAWSADGYAYRCGDGTEFSVAPAEDLSTLTLRPATSVERIEEMVLNRVESDFGTRFEGEGLVFHGRGTSAQLIGQSFSTVCEPIGGATNWGD